MALPLPKVVADVGPGGGLVTSMRGMNALSQDMLNNQILGVQAQYAPLTTQAEAASKLAYANLMGPQFLSKLMGNQDILANIPDDQKSQVLGKLLQAGSGQGTGANILNSLPATQGNMFPSSQSNSFSGYLKNALKNVFGGNTGTPPQTTSTNPFSYNSQQQSQQPVPQPPTNPVDLNPIIGNVPDSEVGRATSAWMKSPEAALQAQKDGMYTIPEAPQLLRWYRGKQGNAPATSSLQATSTQLPVSTFAENAAAYSGVKEEGKESGKIRANDIKDLNDVVFNAETKQATLDDINNMISSPEIREIRQLPLLGRHEMGFYAKEGTPAQQQLVGRLYAQMGNVIKDSSRDFAGQFRRGEQQLLQGMKPSDSDTVDTMIGKAESLSTMNQLLMQRAKTTSQLMNQYHINKGQASEMADKQINGDDIRSQVHNKLNPAPSDDDIMFMSKKYNISPDEVKKRLKAKGII